MISYHSKMIVRFAIFLPVYSLLTMTTIISVVHGFSMINGQSRHRMDVTKNPATTTTITTHDPVGRRQAFIDSLGILLTSSTTTTMVVAVVGSSSPGAAHAYEPDPDPLRESLYLISRIQEATCLQERYINKKLPPLNKMKLTLRLVDRSYRLLDQINYVSKYFDANDVVAASQIGNEAAESLQDAIDFVNGYAKGGNAMTKEQKDFLLAALTDTREKLFGFVAFLPDQTKVTEARKRVEEENKLNVEEYDPDLANDAGIYNPVILPWKERK